MNEPIHEVVDCGCSPRPPAPFSEDAQTMHPFSFDLFQGIHFFADFAVNEPKAKNRRYYNTAAVTTAAAGLEAMLNEQISLSATLKVNPQELYAALDNAKKDISLKDKWNLFAAIRKTTPWDSGKEPYQSCEILFALRNEIMHYKAHFLTHNEAPIKKLQSLLDQIEPTVKPEYRDDTKYWLITILESKNLAGWIKERIRWDILFDLLMMKPRETESK